MNFKQDIKGHIWADFEPNELAQIVKLVKGSEELRQQTVQEIAEKTNEVLKQAAEELTAENKND